MQKPIAWLLVLIGLIVAAALSVLAFQSVRANAAPVLTTPYHAVLLTTGQGFFGRIENLQSDHPVLHDVFYIQSRTNPETKQVANALVKRGGEWHAPDRMILNKPSVLLIEPVREDSQVAKLIAEQSKAR